MIETKSRSIHGGKTAIDVSLTQIRLRVYISHDYYREPILSRLASEHDLVVNITGAKLSANREGQLDLELRGTLQQIQSGLAYLEAFNLTIIGKPNPHGDSWHY